MTTRVAFHKRAWQFSAGTKSKVGLKFKFLLKISIRSQLHMCLTQAWLYIEKPDTKLENRWPMTPRKLLWLLDLEAKATSTISCKNGLQVLKVWKVSPFFFLANDIFIPSKTLTTIPTKCTAVTIGSIMAASTCGLASSLGFVAYVPP